MDPKQLRAACRLAVSVAIDGEVADPRVPAPPELRPVLSFSRLSAAAYATIQRVVDEDGIFRARVAEQADEESVGRAGWLWLHRPVGWLDDEAITSTGAAPAPATAAKRDEKATLARLRKAASDADAARKRTAEQLAVLRRAEAEVRAERDELAATVRVLQDERNAAVRSSKDLEARLAETRRDLKVAREATREAEAELTRLRAAEPAPPATPVALEPAPAPSTAPLAPAASFDRGAVGASVSAAAVAAADLASALAEAASVLAADPGPDDASVAWPPPPAPAPPAKHKGKGKATGKGKHRNSGPARAHPTLPPGVFDGTREAHRHVIGDRANLLLVDGYNVARAAWSDLAPEEERRRTVALLDDLQARSKARVVVVFDGDTAVTAPKASKNVRVRFSASGQTADEAIAELLRTTGAEQPVVVVSSDRAVAADARRQGAVAMGAQAFLVAAGR